MIQMLRGNSRNRPNLKRGYPRFAKNSNSGLNLNYRKIRALTDEERAAIRKRIALQKKLKTRKSILALLISIIILAAAVYGLNELYLFYFG